MFESSVWREAVRKGRAEGRTLGLRKGRNLGRAEGQIIAEREVCLAMVETYHPQLVGFLRAAIARCPDPALLKTWIVEAPRLDAPAFRRLVDGRSGARVARARQRVRRPSRRSKA